MGRSQGSLPDLADLALEVDVDKAVGQFVVGDFELPRRWDPQGATRTLDWRVGALVW